MNTKRFLALSGALLALALWGCGGGAAAPAATPKPGVVYLDPNAAPKATDTPAPAVEVQATEVPAEPVQTEVQASPAAAATPEAEPEAALELYFESRGVRIEPWMEAAPVLQALGQPIGSFEADSCAYIGKDLFYWYPGFELTVNEVEGVDRITAITVTDDTVTIPQGLRIYDDEEKLVSLLGGRDDNGIYTYQTGRTLLLVQVKEAEGDMRRIASMEYRVAVDQ